MATIMQVLRLAVRDALLPQDLAERVPEQSVMSSPASVAAFDAAGAEKLLPIYHFNARAVAALAGLNHHVLDLGSGSGQFLAYLAQHRPDLTITGVELSDGMVELGRERLAQSGLASRVSLLRGDMRELGPFLSKQVDVVTSVFALHHLELQTDLSACLSGVARFAANGAAIWLFDHVRPRRQQTATDFPGVFTPKAEPAFCQDSSNSLRASWSYRELSGALRTSGLAGVKSAKARILPFYQIHWVPGVRNGEHGEWAASRKLSREVRLEAERFERLFRFTPLRPS